MDIAAQLLTQMAKIFGFENSVTFVMVVIFFVVIPTIIYNFFYKTIDRGGEGLVFVKNTLNINHTLRQKYVKLLSNGLAYINNNKILGELPKSSESKTNPNSKLFKDNPWTARSYDFCLRMAFIYPIISLIGAWAFTGDNGSGISRLFPENMEEAHRAIAMVLMITAIALLIVAFSMKKRICFLLLIISSFLIGILTIYGGGVSVPPIILTIVVAICFLGIGAPLIAVSCAFLSILLGEGAGQNLNLIILMVISAIGTIATAILLWKSVYIYESLERRGYLSYSFIILFSVLCASVFLMSALSPKKVGESAKFLLIVLAFLPLLNSLFDWCSVGLTRGLLIKTARSDGERAILNGVIDIIFAFIFLAFLAVAITLSLNIINNLTVRDAHPNGWFGIVQIIDDLSSDRSSKELYFWIFIMLFSTLIPSFFHMSIACLSVITWGTPAKIKTKIYNRLDRGVSEFYPGHFFISIYMTIQMMISIALPILVFYILYNMFFYYIILSANVLLRICKFLTEAFVGTI